MTTIDPALVQQILSLTFRKDGGNRTYMRTTSQITSGHEWENRNGLSALIIHSEYQPSPGAAIPFDRTLGHITLSRPLRIMKLIPPVAAQPQVTNSRA